MGRSKSKPRAQRKFAQGAFVPPQNQPPTPTTAALTRSFHRSLSGPITYNSSSAKDMLTLMSLGKVHLHFSMIPVVELEHNHELDKKLARAVKKKAKIKKKCKENCSVPKPHEEYQLRSHSKRKKHCRSDSDSGEDIPLSFLAHNSNVSTQSTAGDSGSAQLDESLPKHHLPSPSALNDNATGSSQAHDSVLTDSRSSSKLRSTNQRRQTRPVRKKVISRKMSKKRRINKQAGQKIKQALALTLASDPIAPMQQVATETAEITTEQTAEIITEQNVEITTEQTDPEIPMDTEIVNFSTVEFSNPFITTAPDTLVTRNKFNKMNCHLYLVNDLQELLHIPPGTYNYCKLCKRCELLSKYEKVFDMLPVSDDNEPGILEATPRDVYDFDSEDEGLKLLRRGRDLVQNVLTTKRLPIWLSNLEMTLKKTMFHDANKLGTLKMNIFFEPDDVMINKIITRIDYLNQCLTEDKKELSAKKPKRRKSKSMKKSVVAHGRQVSKMTMLPDDTQPLLVPKSSKQRNTEYRTINSNLIESGYNLATTTTSRSPQPGPSNCFGFPSVSSSQSNAFNNLKTDIMPAAETLASPPAAINSEMMVDDDDDDDFCTSLKLHFDEGDDSSSVKSNLDDDNDNCTLNLHLECDSPTPHRKSSFTVELFNHPAPSSSPDPVTVKKKRCSKKVTSMVTSRFYCPNKKPDIDETENFEIPLADNSGENNSPKKVENKFPCPENFTYRPTLEEFEDPIKYMQKIQYAASKYGICKIIPPKGFNIPCHLDDNSMFTTINQYLGRLYQRWGPTIREMTGIQVYLAKINPRERDQFTKCPMFDGVEIDLVKLYYAVRERGGVEELLAHREHWVHIAQQLALVSPRGKPDHKKLEKLYCKHVLPYEYLTPEDRESLLLMVDTVWKERYQSLSWRANRPLHYQKRMLGECESDDEEPTLDLSCESIRTAGKPCFERLEECTGKGRTMNLTTYRRLASQLKAMRFPKNPDATTKEIEDAYWQLLSLGREHLCVLSACIDTTVDKLGHTYHPDEPGGSHPWNLKRLGENPLNVMSILGKTLSVTEPTLCLNQVFSTNCWHKDPHLLAWMDYMHEGSTKVWYAVSENDSGQFRESMEHLAPFAVQNKGIWLTSDTTMVPPGMLLSNDVKLQRIEQNPGEFIVVLPGAYASSIATGMTISESVYFEEEEWVYRIHNIFKQMRDDHEPGMFSNIVLLFRMARDPRASLNVLPFIHKSIENIVKKELKMRQKAIQLDFDLMQVKSEGDPGAVSWPNQEECSICRAPLILSKTVRFNDHRLLVCLKHGVQLYDFASVEERGNPPAVTIIYSKDELMEILECLSQRIIEAQRMKEELLDNE